MRQILLGAAAIGLALALTAGADAGGKPGPSQGGGNHNSRGGGDYHLSHGSRMKDGSYSNKGRDHGHWRHRSWHGKYGCYTYWCPSASRWYYWYVRDGYYYPVGCTPTPIPTPPGVPGGVTQVANVNNGSPGSSVGGGSGTPAPRRFPVRQVRRCLRAAR